MGCHISAFVVLASDIHTSKPGQQKNLNRARRAVKQPVRGAQRSLGLGTMYRTVLPRLQYTMQLVPSRFQSCNETIPVPPKKTTSQREPPHHSSLVTIQSQAPKSTHHNPQGPPRGLLCRPRAPTPRARLQTPGSLVFPASQSRPLLPLAQSLFRRARCGNWHRLSVVVKCCSCCST